MSDPTSLCSGSSVSATSLPKSVEQTLSEVSHIFSRSPLANHTLRSVDTSQQEMGEKEFAAFNEGVTMVTVAQTLEVECATIRRGEVEMDSVKTTTGPWEWNTAVSVEGEKVLDGTERNGQDDRPEATVTSAAPVTCDLAGYEENQARTGWDTPTEPAEETTEEGEEYTEGGEPTAGFRKVAMAAAIRDNTEPADFDKQQFEKELEVGVNKFVTLMEGSLNNQTGETWGSGFLRFQSGGRWDLETSLEERELCLTMSFDATLGDADLAQATRTVNVKSVDDWIGVSHDYSHDGCDDRLDVIPAIRKAFPVFGSPKFDDLRANPRTLQVLYQSSSGPMLELNFFSDICDNPWTSPIPLVGYLVRVRKYVPVEVKPAKEPIRTKRPVRPKL